MPNIVGIIDPVAERAALERDVEHMLDVVDIPEFGFTRRRVVAPGVAVGNVLTGIEDNLSQPVRDPSTGAWLMLDGEILGDRELKSDLTRAGREVEGLDDAGLALLAYQTFGETFIERLNGQWNIVLHHPQAELTVIASDRVGSRILYLAKDAQRLVFASEMKAVVVGRKVASKAGGFGLLELLMGPYHHGDRTWIDGIRVFDPGTVMKVRSGHVETRRYWRLSFNEGGSALSQDDCAETFAGELRGAVRRCMKRDPAHRIAITLSGGLDSRAIALSIANDEKPLAALTYGDDDSADVLYARQLADVIGLDFNYVEEKKQKLFEASRAVLDRVLGPPTRKARGFYGSQIDRIVWRDEVMGDPMGAASMLWHPLYCRHMDLMLQGACGDALTGSHVTWAQMKSPSRDQLITQMMAGQYYAPREILELVLNRKFLDRYWGEREARFRGLFDQIDADDAVSISNIWDMENRQRRGAFSTFTMERYFCVVRAPFLDYALLDFLPSLPVLWRFQQQVYKRMIVGQYPYAAHVPWAYSRRRITASPGYEFMREVSSYARRRIEGVFRPKRADAQYAFRDTGALLREDPEMAVAVDAWLESDQFDPEVFNAAGIRRLLDRHFGGDTAEPVWMAYGYVNALARAHRFVLDPQRTPPDECNPASYGVQAPAPRTSR